MDTHTHGMSDTDKIITLEGYDYRSTVVKVDVPFLTVCPIPEEYGERAKPYSGTLSIIYMVSDTLLEWDTFAKYIASFAGKSYSAEQFVHSVTALLLGRLEPQCLTVRAKVRCALHLPVTIQTMHIHPKAGVDAVEWISMSKEAE